uniref:Cysteine-rich receptor-like protein kinase 17 n=2 Tax=Noccaea caerulescens TaxID=107243 RepID=A0A1J3I335_NOCCA
MNYLKVKKMGKKSSVSSILCFLLISFSAIFVSSQHQICDESYGMFKPNSSYDKNRRLILSTLASNMTSHDGYIRSSVGLDPDIVYAMGMCAPDTAPNDCSSCIQDASRYIQQICLNQTDAFSWFGEKIICLVRYCNRSVPGLLVLEPYQVLFNNTEIEKNIQKEFESVRDGLMLRMITNSSSKYYAKDVAPVPLYGNMSVLMLCTPDISSRDCKLCLESSVNYYKRWYPWKRGVIILRPSCFFRWELYTFSGTNIRFSPWPSQPPSPPPSVSNLTNIPKKDTRFSRGILAAIVVVIFVFIVLIAIGVAIFKGRKEKQETELPTESIQFDLKTIEVESIQFDLKTIEAATSNFSERNKLGQGGFGEVYKGMLMNGTEIAVKRLSKTSGQGEVEFKNEVVVVAKLQHRNLVRLLGFSLQGEEKILVYEFVHNKSLDYFLFDHDKRIQLDWTVRCHIIGGITRGILYLHQDSRLKIIHRDLKASNVLLDSDMNPKISDFGMARIFGMDQTQENTSRIVGTYGYMSPEYAMHGQYSMKSDVYSFGVLVLEIISGKKNSSFYQTDGAHDLVSYAWRLWSNGTPLDLVDPVIIDNCQRNEVVRCVHVGLLCVQEDPVERPTLSTIVLMLTSNTVTLPVPREPGLFFESKPTEDPLDSYQSIKSKSVPCSVDDASITELHPR